MVAARKRFPKRHDVLGVARARLAGGRFRDSRHAEQRKEERGVDFFDIERVIKTGWHEAREDRYKEEHGSWTYAIRGNTVDGMEVRIVIAFDEEDYLVVVTARPP